MSECICGKDGHPMNSTACPVHGAWRPIETAPKDGTPFLGAIFWPSSGQNGEWEILRMNWKEEFQVFGDATYAPFVEDQEQPTHWQPMPEPPK